MDAYDIGAPKGSHVGRSVAGWHFTEAGCGGRPSTGIATWACDPQDFPWTSAASRQNTELFDRGASSLQQATFDVDTKLVLREIVLKAVPGSLLAQRYRDHLSTCGAKVVATSNGQLLQATLHGSVNLVVAFQDDKRIVALLGLGGQGASELTQLAQTAVGRT